MDRRDANPRAAAAATFLAVLRAGGGPLTAARLKQCLIDAGEPVAAVESAWRRAQPVLRRHPDVVFDSVRGAYLFAPGGGSVPSLTAAEALARLVPPGVSGRRAELVGIVAAALAERDDLEARLRAGYAEARQIRAAQHRQARIDAVRVLAEVLAEVEELFAAGAEPAVTVERIRALGEAFGLSAIGRAGQAEGFRPERHTPIGSRPSDDAPVTVVRPGYTWWDGTEVVLISPAQVAPVNVHIGGSGAGG